MVSLLSITTMTSMFGLSDAAMILYELETRRKVVIAAELIKTKAYEDGISRDDLMNEVEDRIFKISYDNAHYKGNVRLKDALGTAIKSIEKAYQDPNSVSGITTGFKDLDQLLYGFHNSDLVIIAARPAMGKTSFMLNLAENAAKHLRGEKASVGIFSLEMSSEQIAMRFLSMNTGLSMGDMKKGSLDQDQFVKLMKLSMNDTIPYIHIDDTAALTIGSIFSRVRRYVRKNNVKILFIDYLQLLYPKKEKANMNRTNEVSEISRGLKEIAKEFNIPVIALSQLSRKVEDRSNKRPHLSDLRDSGSIEQDADIVIFIHREEYFLRMDEPEMGTQGHYEWQQEMDKVRGRASIIIAKHRNGPTGDITLHFDAGTTKFANYEFKY